MQIADDKKVDILLNVLNERYNSAHRMRERSQNFAIWVLGFGIALTWMLLTDVTLILYEKLILTLFIVILGGIAKKFLRSIEIGFDRNREIMIRVEGILGFYKEDIYKQGSSLFPKEYEKPSNKETSHFYSLFIWLLTIEIFLLFLIWLENILGFVKHIVCKT